MFTCFPLSPMISCKLRFRNFGSCHNSPRAGFSLVQPRPPASPIGQKIGGKALIGREGEVGRQNNRLDGLGEVARLTFLLKINRKKTKHMDWCTTELIRKETLPTLLIYCLRSNKRESWCRKWTTRFRAFFNKMFWQCGDLIISFFWASPCFVWPCVNEIKLNFKAAWILIPLSLWVEYHFSRKITNNAIMTGNIHFLLILVIPKQTSTCPSSTFIQKEMVKLIKSDQRF